MTSLLTVWRKLHVEVDSMGNVGSVQGEENTITGNITNVNAMAGNKYVLTTDQNLSDDVDRFQNGVLKQNGHDYVVESNSAGANFTVTVTGTPAPVVGPFTSLVDDDHLQDGQPVRKPLTDTLAAAMAAAFVTVGFDREAFNTTPVVQFDQNTAGIVELLQLQEWDTEGQNSPSFWVAYIFGAFQGPKSEDYDPATPEDGAKLGATPIPEGGSAIYLEVIVDRSKDVPYNAVTLEQTTVVHEVGHAVGNSDTHPVTGIEDQDPNTGPSEYVEAYLKLIRQSVQPAP